MISYFAVYNWDYSENKFFSQKINNIINILCPLISHEIISNLWILIFWNISMRWRVVRCKSKGGRRVEKLAHPKYILIQILLRSIWKYRILKLLLKHNHLPDPLRDKCSESV